MLKHTYRTRVLVTGRLTALVLGALLLTGTAALAASGGATDPETLDELAQVRQATTKYHDVEAAIADGYVPVGPFVPGMGFHYVNAALLADGFDLTAPEVLLYAPTGEGGVGLVGVEYSVVGPVPAGFSGSDDHWELHEASCHYIDLTEELCATPADADPAKTLEFWHPDFQILHVWVWKGNPEGVFHHTNRLVD